MTDQDVRDFLERMAAEEPVQFLDAAPLTRRARGRAVRTAIVGTIAVTAAIAVLFAVVAEIRSTRVPADDPTPAPAPSVDLGIFAPVAGRIVYGDRDGIWGVDPAAPEDPATRVLLTSEAGIPLGWSSDGTRLLIEQRVRGERVVAGGRGTLRLSVLDADGSETQVSERQGGSGATISPDGSRVVFATYRALYSVEVGGSRPVVLAEDQSFATAPTFSPDGTQIAYVVGSGDSSHRVWVMNADGSDAHQILANETTLAAGHVFGLEWSPAGDRIALGLQETTYTFAPDGSGFTQTITYGHRPYWSPDGSQLAYKVPCGGCGLAIADADGSNARAFAVFKNSGPWHPGQRTATVPLPTDPTAPPEESNADLGIFSSVGGWIAFESHGAYGAVAPDGSERTVLLDGRKDLWAQDWSPDGSRLLVALDDAGGSRGVDLAVIEPDGSETTLVETSFDGASFSPNGATVVYARWARAGQLLTVASDGSGEPRLLLESKDLLYQPTYSPDGTQIAYVDGGGDHSHTIRVVNADGTDVRVLIDATPPFDGASHIFGLEWSPDGSLIAVGVGDGLEGQGIYTVRPDGTDLRLLIPGAVNPSWSPDGSLIAYSPYRADLNRGVWVANADGSDPRMLSPGGLAGPWNPGAPADRG